jgi:AAA family ATP:ADP antiporter
MTGHFPYRRDEAVQGALLSAHLFVSVASIVLGKAARDAIFLSRYSPQQMAAADIATMIAAALVIGAQMRLNATVRPKRILLIAPLCFALGDLALWLGLTTSSGGAMTRMVYLWIGIQASFGAPQASLLACQILTLRQAKRLCGLIGAGSILGWIGGGLLAQLLAAQFGAASLLLGSGALLILCPVFVSALWLDTPLQNRPPDRSRPSGGLWRSASIVWASPHLRALACLALVSSAVTTIVGFQFKDVASRSMATGDHLAAFFGSFSFQAGLVALAAQCLLTRRIVGSLGLGLVLMIAPAAIAAGSLGVLFSGTLAAAVLLKGTDQVVRYSVDRAAVELLYRPLSQGEILEGKTFIDALVCRFGDALGGIVTLLVAVVLRFGFRWLSMISLALLFGWLISAAVARRCYRERLRDNLHRPRIVRDDASTGGHGPLPRGFARRGATREQDILSADSTVRLHSLRSLCRKRALRPDAGVDEKRLAIALAAEIVGLAVLVETTVGCGTCSPDDRRAAQDAIERIARLLYLISPARYPDSVRAALRSGDLFATVAVLEYLDNTLPGPHRPLLISLLERCPAFD